VIASLAWGSDARCLALTTRGLSFWDGTGWSDAPSHGLSGIRFVRRLSPGSFVIAAEGDELYVYTREGARAVGARRGRPSGIQLLDGDVDDLAVVVARSPGSPPELGALSGGRWLRSVPVVGAAHLASLSRVDDDVWLVVGRTTEGGPYAALYAPLAWELVPIPTNGLGALVASASLLERRTGIAVGGRGLVVRVESGRARSFALEGEPDLSAAGIDVLDGAWVAGSGRVWYSPAQALGFTPVWHDERWVSPFIALWVDVGFAIAVTVDGGVVEFRDPSPARTPSVPPSR
jgi:hypothetical protein